jgi:hypothetical protein
MFPEGLAVDVKTADEVAPMILSLVDMATRDTEVLTQRDGTVLPW